MTHRAPPDIRLAHRLHRDRRQYPRRHSRLFERVLQRERVDNRRQHPHLIGGRAIHPALLVRAATQDIARADHQRELDPQTGYFLDLERNRSERIEIDPAVMRRRERLA
jgi:hypothetical protein